MLIVFSPFCCGGHKNNFAYNFVAPLTKAHQESDFL